MSGQPPPVPLKYKMAAEQAPPQPTRVALPPPRKPRIGRWEAVFRVVVVLVILSSVAVAYWSFYHVLAPLQKEARSVITKVSAASARLDQMENRWAPDKVEEIRARYRDVYGQLFTSRAELEEWLSQVQAPASWLALDVKVVFGKGTPQAEPPRGLTVIPVSLSLMVKPQPLETQNLSPYERVLGFNQLLAAHGKRADLAEMDVTGGVGSISHAYLTFNLWAGDLMPEVEAATINAPSPTAK